MDDSARQTTLAGFFGKPKTGPAPPSRPTSAASQAAPKTNPPKTEALSAPSRPPASSSPASSQALKTPSSALGSSPNVANGDRRRRAGSPLKQSHVIDDEDDSADDLSPPPEVPVLDIRKDKIVKQARQESQEDEQDSMDVDPEAGPSRRAKRKVVYAESNSGSSDDDDVPLKASSKGRWSPDLTSNARSSLSLGRRPRKSLKNDSDSDDFVFDADDDAVMCTFSSSRVTALNHADDLKWRQRKSGKHRRHHHPRSAPCPNRLLRSYERNRPKRRPSPLSRPSLPANPHPHPYLPQCEHLLPRGHH